MQGGKNWILPKEMHANRFFWDSHWLEIWSNHLFSSMGPNGGVVTMDSRRLPCRLCSLLFIYCRRFINMERCMLIRARIFKLTFKEPNNRFQGTNFARLCSLAGRKTTPFFSVPSPHRLFKNFSTAVRKTSSVFALPFLL
jgi:hypothetical protein